MWTAGQRVGAYEVVAKLRDGGMATLYLARLAGPTSFSRHVALKVIQPLLAGDEQFRNMFLDEAMLSSRIEHPNVVRVEELGQHEDAHYLTMEFVHGCSLAQLQRALIMQKRRLSPAFAARIAMHVAEGLQAAHELRDSTGRLLNVVHRDVTPENVLLAYAGQVKLIDFGIAKAYGRRHRTQDGLLKGKFRYMAPEQALGKPVDRRVDLYQLGIVLWEMLTLRRLFAAERDIDLLRSVQRPRIEPPSHFVDRIPPALDEAVMMTLDPDPRRRPTDALALARLLERAVPAARDVDAGALRALLLATMSEHRMRERGAYPPGVYERLDQLAVSPEPQAFARTSHRSHAQTLPLGSEPPAPRESMGVTRGAARVRRGRKPVVLARLASELRTTLTRVAEAGFVGSRTYWMLIGSAVGLLAAIVLITLALPHNPRRVSGLPPRLPMKTAQVAQAPPLLVPLPVAHAPTQEHTAEADAGIVALPANESAPTGVRRSKHAVSPGRAPKGAARLGVITGDETPLRGDPGI